MRDVRPDSQMVQMLHDGRSSRPQLDRSHTPREQAWRRQLAAWQGTPGTSPVQFALSTATVPPAVAPMTAAALSVWILANCSERVKRLVNEAQFQLDITWDDAIPGAVAQTDMHLDYTDAAGVAGTINLFLGTAAADMAALAYPLAAHVLRIPLAVNAADTPDPGSPAAVARVTKWRTNLAHELEVHTALATQIADRLQQMNRRGQDIPAARDRITDSIDIRSGNAEHAGLASGSGGVSATFTRVVVSAPPAQQAALLIDAAMDRYDHVNHIALPRDQKLALRDTLTWVNRTLPQMAPPSAADTARITSLKSMLQQAIGAL